MFLQHTCMQYAFDLFKSRGHVNESYTQLVVRIVWESRIIIIFFCRLMKATLRYLKLLFYHLTIKHQFILLTVLVCQSSLIPTLILLHLIQSLPSQMIAQSSKVQVLDQKLKRWKEKCLSKNIYFRLAYSINMHAWKQKLTCLWVNHY